MKLKTYKDSFGRIYSIVPYLCIKEGCGPGIKLYFVNLRGSQEEAVICNNILVPTGTFEDAQNALDNWAIENKLIEQIKLPEPVKISPRENTKLPEPVKVPLQECKTSKQGFWQNIRWLRKQS